MNILEGSADLVVVKIPPGPRWRALTISHLLKAKECGDYGGMECGHKELGYFDETLKVMMSTGVTGGSNRCGQYDLEAAEVASGYEFLSKDSGSDESTVLVDERTRL